MADLKDAQQIAREFMSRQSLTLDVAPELATWIKPLADLLCRERAAAVRAAKQIVLNEAVDAKATGDKSDYSYNQALVDADRALESFAQSLAKEKP